MVARDSEHVVAPISEEDVVGEEGEGEHLRTMDLDHSVKTMAPNSPSVSNKSGYKMKLMTKWASLACPKVL